MAADSSNEVNLSKHKVVIHVAADNKYLTKQGGLSDFAVNNLKFYEEKLHLKEVYLVQPLIVLNLVIV